MPKRIEFYDQTTERQMCYVYAGSGEVFEGWLLYRHVDGHWVTSREATEDDIERLNSAGSESALNGDQK